MNNIKYLGDLPFGYEYKILKVDGSIRFIGISPSTGLIAFELVDDELAEIDCD